MVDLAVFEADDGSTVIIRAADLPLYPDVKKVWRINACLSLFQERELRRARRCVRPPWSCRGWYDHA